MFSKIKGFIFEEENNSTAAKAPQSSGTSVPVQAPGAMPLVAADSTPGTALNVPEITKAIEDLIRAAPEFGPYAAFERAAESMKAVVPEEGMRFKAAQAASGGITCDDLVQALLSHKTVLQNESDRFQQTFVQAAETEVKNINDEADKLQQQADELARQLAEISQRKEALIEEGRQKALTAKKAAIDFANIIEGLGLRYASMVRTVQQHLGAK